MALTEQFAGGNSWLHRLDPRAKLIGALLWSVALAVLKEPGVLLGGVLTAAVFLISARLEPMGLLRRLLLVNLFVALLWLFLPWSVPGEEWASWGPIILTRAGLRLAIQLSLRCNAIVGLCIALLGTSRLVDLAHGLAALGLPQKLVLTIFFCVRYIQAIHDEYGRMTAAIKLRAFRPRSTLHTYRTYANLVGMLLVRSHDRAERVHEAMVCRGFEGRLHTLEQHRLSGYDIAAIIILASLTLALVGFEWLTTD